MKISELIVELQRKRRDEGDLVVVAGDFGCGCCGSYETPVPHLRVAEDPDYFDSDIAVEPGDKILVLNY